MASAINVLDDIHGGAGAAVHGALPRDRRRGGADGRPRRGRAAVVLQRHRDAGVEVRSRLRPPLPSARSRAPRVCSSLVDARGRGGRRWTGGSRRSAARSRMRISEGKPKRMPMNIDGVTAVIYCELGFDARTRAGRLHPVALGRDPRPRQRADAAGRPDQGPRAEVDRLHLHRAGTTIRARTNATNEGERHEGPGVEPDRPLPGGTRCRAHLRAVRSHEHRPARGAREEREHLLHQRAARADRGARGRRLRAGDRAGRGRADPPRPGPDERDHRRGQRRTRLDPDGRDRRRRAERTTSASTRTRRSTSTPTPRSGRSTDRSSSARGASTSRTSSPRCSTRRSRSPRAVARDRCSSTCRWTCSRPRSTSPCSTRC